MAPVIRALRASNWARCLVVVTAQHRELLDHMLDLLSIQTDYDLNLMQKDQSPSELLARMMPTMERIYTVEKPSVVLAQGDTTTVFGSALTAFHKRIPFGHVEAGLRSGAVDNPFPEEGYRQMVSRIANWHFAPTDGAAEALRAEGIKSDKIHVTGNTGIDTLLQTVETLTPITPSDQKTLLLTAHRRESFGAPLISIFHGVLNILDQLPEAKLIYPVHPNPNVSIPARRILGAHPRISLIEPLNYVDFVDLMRRATLILTDSGGIQEEAPALGVPVLVLRDTTERPEGVVAGVSRLIGTNADSIASAVLSIIRDPSIHSAMSRKKISPYGDGLAAIRIEKIIRTSLSQ